MAKLARRRRPSWRIVAGLVLLALAAGAYGWWRLHHWRPDPTAYPAQGAEIGERDLAEGGTIDWRALRAGGARFVYLDASAGAFARDPGFTAGLAAARAAGLRVGVVHRYDPCQPADPQAANFAALVPRDAALLPAAIELARTADDCAEPVTDAAVESELTTFLNQVETHTGTPALLKLSPAVERRYALAARFDRRLWLSRAVLQPDYAGRPWSLWSANPARWSDAAPRPLRWVVAQP